MGIVDSQYLDVFYRDKVSGRLAWSKRWGQTVWRDRRSAFPGRPPLRGHHYTGREKDELVRGCKCNRWLVLLISYMLVSILWSDIPFVAFKRWVREFTAVIMALLVLSEPAPRQALESVLRRTVYVLIPFSVLLIKYFPDLGVIYSRWTGEIQWIGVTLQKNGLGRLCLISAFFLVWTLTRRWQGGTLPLASTRPVRRCFF